MGYNFCRAQFPKVSNNTKAPSGDVVVLRVVVAVLVIVCVDVAVREVIVLVTLVTVVVGVQFLKVNHSVCAGRQLVAGGATVMTRESSSSQYRPS